MSYETISWKLPNCKTQKTSGQPSPPPQLINRENMTMVKTMHEYMYIHRRNFTTAIIKTITQHSPFSLFFPCLYPHTIINKLSAAFFFAYVYYGLVLLLHSKLANIMRGLMMNVFHSVRFNFPCKNSQHLRWQLFRKMAIESKCLSENFWTRCKNKTQYFPIKCYKQ